MPDIEKEKFSFDAFHKSDLKKEYEESFDKPENSGAGSYEGQIVPMSDNEVKFAIKSIVKNFR